MIGWEPADHSLGILFYTFAFMGAYTGSYISSGRKKAKVELYSFKYLVKLVARNLPNVFIMLITYLDWKKTSFPVRLVGKFLIPPFLSMFYLYGFSDLFLTIIKLD